MSNTTPVNTVAPVVNVGICMTTLESIMERDQHLPGIGVFYGPSGYGKSMAAAYAANKTRAYYIECKSCFTKKALLLAILREMGVTPAKNLYEMTEQVCDQLINSNRPLIIDEMDHIVEKKAVESIRDIYDGSEAPILLIGEEMLPRKLERYERFHRRILEFAGAEPITLDDAKVVRQLYSPDVDIADDLFNEVLKLARGSVGRVTVNISRIARYGKDEGIEIVDLAAWGDRPLYTGSAPVRKV
jgi:DNA transposition AAA+ family ATPase